VRGGSDLLRPNREFAAHRGFQSSWQHQTATRRIFPPLVAIRIEGRISGTAIGSLIRKRFHPVLSKATFGTVG
jgi:hypothetical protein